MVFLYSKKDSLLPWLQPLLTVAVSGLHVFQESRLVKEQDVKVLSVNVDLVCNSKSIFYLYQTRKGLLTHINYEALSYI